MSIEKALTNLRPNSSWIIRDGVLEWLDKEQTKPTQSEIDAEVSRLKSIYDATQYQRDRLQEYPNTNDLIVALWEKVIEGRSESADALEVKRQEVKTAHPKPE